jgi:SAM-dependent methyltransferase
MATRPSNLLENTASGGYWDRIVDGWNQRGDDAVWRAHSDNVNARLLDRWLPERGLGKVLKTDLFDEAVAEGLYPTLQQRSRNVAGIDASPKVARAAQVRHPRMGGLAADVLHLPFADGHFDAVISISTLDHFDSLDKIPEALKELYRVLAPGGKLVVTLDNGSNPAVALRNRLPYKLLRTFGLVPYEMGVTCTANRFFDLMRTAGFQIEDRAFLLHVPRLPAVVASRVVERIGSAGLRAGFLRILAAGEIIRGWPTRSLTGYFVAAMAVKQP